MLYAEAQIRAGADTIGMSDAAACMIGPRHYGRFLFPRQLRVVESIRRAHPDVIVRLHMCGNTDPLILQMRQLPVQIFELDSPTNLEVARAALGLNRVILGNVATIADMLEGTPEQVYEASSRCHKTCGRFHIVGTGCEMPPATAPENLHAMVRYAREHRPEEWA
jgi:uroporphyrinogen-III decarboxylase